MSKENLKRLVDACGGQSELARRISEKLPHMKVRQSHIWNWLTLEGRVPPGDYLPVLEVIAKELGLHIKGKDLRPEIYPKFTRRKRT